MNFNYWICLAVPFSILGIGCSIAPKTFRKLTDPAPIVRARSVSLGSSLPTERVVPSLIDSLEDKDPVVRLAAFEELKKGTGRTFGFVPWSNEADRAKAIARWRSWWKDRQGSLARVKEMP